MRVVHVRVQHNHTYINQNNINNATKYLSISYTLKTKMILTLITAHIPNNNNCVVNSRNRYFIFHVLSMAGAALCLWIYVSCFSLCCYWWCTSQSTGARLKTNIIKYKWVDDHYFSRKKYMQKCQVLFKRNNDTKRKIFFKKTIEMCMVII